MDALLPPQIDEFDVCFEGGSGYFLTAKSLNRFELSEMRKMIQGIVVNGFTIFGYIDPDLDITVNCSSGRMILLTHPHFSGAALALTNWRCQNGIPTTLALVDLPNNGGIGNTPHQIKNFIQDRFDNCTNRPSYVLIMGDAEFVPPASDGPGPSDHGYSVLAGEDQIADVGLGRISVDTPEEAWVVVNKIINYEQNPPNEAKFYQNAAFVSHLGGTYLGCGKSHDSNIQTLETIGEVMKAEGYKIDHLYWSDEPNRDTYCDGSPLPAHLDQGFSWDASAQEIHQSLNDGRFLILHLSYDLSIDPFGYWVDPSFGPEDVAALSNSPFLPVLFSAYGKSGLFANELKYNVPDDATFLVENLLRREGGGIVGAIAGSTETEGIARNAFMRGLADAVFLELMPFYGKDDPLARLSSIIRRAKLYLATRINIQYNHVLEVSTTGFGIYNDDYQVQGDPSMEMWLEKP